VANGKEELVNTEHSGETDSQRDRTGFREALRAGMESMRQLMQPRAFRIAAPEAYDEPPPSETIADGQTTGQPPPPELDEQLTAAIKTLATVATALWRIRTKLDAEAKEGLPDKLRNIPRHMEAAWDALTAGKVQVDDFAGQRYVPGMAVNILTFQPLEGLGSEIIHETVKPSVYYGDTLVQRADVIVGRPIAESDVQQTNDATRQEGAEGDTHAPAETESNPYAPDND